MDEFQLNTAKAYKVCILTAGEGTRLGEYSAVINKALLPVGEHAVISSIIEKFPDAEEFVIAVGYKQDQVRGYLRLAHPDIPFRFVEVEPFAGPGSGPGFSLLQCGPALAKNPFFFVSCDTLWVDKNLCEKRDRDWIGVAPVRSEQTPSYCNVIVQNEKAVNLINKKFVDDNSACAFTGLGYIHNFEIFWSGLAESLMHSDGAEPQVIAGFAALMNAGLLYTTEIDWQDVGSFDLYRNEISRHLNYDFSKSNEFLYFSGSRVIKFYADPETVNRRVRKVSLNPSVFPEMAGTEGQFYAYQSAAGEVLYRHSQPAIFKDLIKWMEAHLWKKHNGESRIVELCHKFYHNKTMERLALYETKNGKRFPSLVNEAQRPPVTELLKSLDWNFLTDGAAFFMHGDLQPDNILYDVNKKLFTLLDWRQDFGGCVEYGDIYYDFAKLWGGLNLNYYQVKNNRFEYHEEGDECRFVIPHADNHAELKTILEDYIQSRGYSVKKVRQLVGLVYLNMSPLHHEPFDRLLHALAREVLHESLQL